MRSNTGSDQCPVKLRTKCGSNQCGAHRGAMECRPEHRPNQCGANCGAIIVSDGRTDGSSVVKCSNNGTKHVSGVCSTFDLAKIDGTNNGTSIQGTHRRGDDLCSDGVSGVYGPEHITRIKSSHRLRQHVRHE